MTDSTQTIAPDILQAGVVAARPGSRATISPTRFALGLIFFIVSYAAVSVWGGERGYLAARLVWWVCAVLISIGTWRAWRTTEGVEQRLWEYLCASSLSLAAGEAFFALHMLLGDRGDSTLLTLATAFTVLSICGFVALVGTFMRFRHASQVSRVRYMIDLAAACVVLVGVLEMRVIGPFFDQGVMTGAGTKALYSLYPVLGVLTLSAVLWLAVVTRFDRWEYWAKLLGAGAASFAAGVVMMPIAYVERRSMGGGWYSVAVDVAQIAGMYCVLVASVHRVRNMSRNWSIRSLTMIEPSYGLVACVILPAIEMVAVPAFGIASYATADPASRMLRTGIAATVAMALVARTVLAAIDNDELLASALTDPLTGLFNHRHFQECLSHEMTAATRSGQPLGVIAIDVDDFGAVNTHGGHVAGDAALVEVARAVQRGVRAGDIVCRVGGDEIAVILPATDGTVAYGVALRVLEEIRSIPGHVPLSASAGIACHPDHATSRDELVRRVDGALYWAKYHGKDRAVLFDPEVVVVLDPGELLRKTRHQADMEAVRTLAAAVDARDPATQNRSRRVASLAVRLAKELGFSDRETSLLEAACLLHDIGRIATPDHLLHMKVIASEDEEELVRRHVLLGEEILSFTAMQEMLPFVRHHHERWDGKGYPDGLAGEDIPFGARVIALCAAYADLVSSAPGGGALSRHSALQMIDLRLGSEFDPALGDKLITMLGREAL